MARVHVLCLTVCLLAASAAAAPWVSGIATFTGEVRTASAPGHYNSMPPCSGYFLVHPTVHTVLYTSDVPSALIFYQCLTNDRRKTPSLLPTVPVATAP